MQHSTHEKGRNDSMSNILTNQEETFALEYYTTNHQTNSYRKAYPHTKNWKDSSVSPRASKLAKSDKIVTRLEELRAAAKESSKITVTEVVQEICNMATIRECDFYHDDGSVKLLSELSDQQKAALAEYRVKKIRDGVDENGKPKWIEIPVFKVHDKSKALDMLMKHLGGYAPEKHEHSGEIRTGMDSFYATVKPDEE